MQEDSLKEFKHIVYESIGTASVCWSELPSGVFDSSKALQCSKNILNQLTPKLSLEIMKDSFQKDPNYAFGWLCFLAVTMQDSGVSYNKSQKIAKQIMKSLFDCDNYDPAI